MSIEKTPIQKLKPFNNNELYIKRDDLIPFSFGGNKARKAELFFEEIDAGNFDCVVTYGSSSSNHCRIISNLAASRGMMCYIISPQESSQPTFNSKLMRVFGAEITVVPVSEVHQTIENLLADLTAKGCVPYFIPGGGHGNTGTQAYVNCYNEIREYELQNNIYFDYIFHASGTGTTQAGLVCGQLINGDKRKIVGISIARPNPRGRQVVIDSINDYLSENGFYISSEQIEAATVFDDSFIGNGYGDSDSGEFIKKFFIDYGIPLDSTYTGKAFKGTEEYIRINNLCDSNILFIHTGGTPLFFDCLNQVKDV